MIPTQPSAEKPASSLRVLLVEDEPIYQDLFSNALAGEAPQFDLQIVDCGADALRTFNDSALHFDIVLVDIGLPDISGIDVIHAARKCWISTPVVVVSSCSDEVNVLNAIRAGAQGYLYKNDDALNIGAAILRTVKGEYPISPALARHIFKLAVPVHCCVKEVSGPAFAPKELELLVLISKGYSYKKAAHQMEIQLSTIQTYIRLIYRKLEAHSKIEAISNAQKIGLL